MMFLAKGVPYTNEKDNNFKVWINGAVIPLTTNQTIIWKYFYGNVKTYNDLMKYIKTLFEKNIILSKEVLIQTLRQLRGLNLLSYFDAEDEKEGEFIVIFKNKIKPLKKLENFNEFESMVYDFIENCDNISLADFICDIDNNFNYDKLTNGYDIDYLKFAYNNIHSKITCNIVKKFLKDGICYVV